MRLMALLEQGACPTSEISPHRLLRKGLPACGQEQGIVPTVEHEILIDRDHLTTGTAELAYSTRASNAGTYSVLQPKLAYELRDRKLKNLAPLEAQTIVSANIGCIQHLQSGAATPVRHWVALLNDALAG